MIGNGVILAATGNMWLAVYHFSKRRAHLACGLIQTVIGILLLVFGG